MNLNHRGCQEEDINSINLDNQFGIVDKGAAIKYGPGIPFSTDNPDALNGLPQAHLIS